MSEIPEEPPDENEQYEQLDEALDEADLPGRGGGPEGGRDLDADIVVDQVALHDIGADLDDPDRISLLDGAMDDPDGAPPPTGSNRRRTGPGYRGVDGSELAEGDEFERVDDVEVPQDAADMDQVPDDPDQDTASRRGPR